MTPSLVFATEEPLWRRLFPNHEWALLAMLLVETVIFAFIGNNFFTGANGFEIIRLSVELGLLAMALTPVIVTGGIDLSVGSMMGLSAILFGWLWRDADKRSHKRAAPAVDRRSTDHDRGDGLQFEPDAGVALNVRELDRVEGCGDAR